MKTSDILTLKRIFSVNNRYNNKFRNYIYGFFYYYALPWNERDSKKSEVFDLVSMGLFVFLFVLLGLLCSEFSKSYTAFSAIVIVTGILVYLSASRFSDRYGGLAVKVLIAWAAILFLLLVSTLIYAGIVFDKLDTQGCDLHSCRELFLAELGYFRLPALFLEEFYEEFYFVLMLLVFIFIFCRIVLLLACFVLGDAGFKENFGVEVSPTERDLKLKNRLALYFCLLISFSFAFLSIFFGGDFWSLSVFSFISSFVVIFTYFMSVGKRAVFGSFIVPAFLVTIILYSIGYIYKNVLVHWYAIPIFLDFGVDYKLLPSISIYYFFISLVLDYYLVYVFSGFFVALFFACVFLISVFENIRHKDERDGSIFIRWAFSRSSNPRIYIVIPAYSALVIFGAMYSFLNDPRSVARDLVYYDVNSYIDCDAVDEEKYKVMIISDEFKSSFSGFDKIYMKIDKDEVVKLVRCIEKNFSEFDDFD